MVEVRVLKDGLLDRETKNYHKIKRRGKEIDLNGKLMFKEDEYSTSKKRAEYLSKRGLVEIIKNEKKGQAAE